MTYKQALKIYMENNRRGSRIVKRIAKWKENKTVADNAKALKFSTPNEAAQFARRFGLVSLKARPHSRIYEEIEEIRKLRDMDYTFAEISRIYSVSRQRIEQLLAQNKQETAQTTPQEAAK